MTPSPLSSSDEEEDGFDITSSFRSFLGVLGITAVVLVLITAAVASTLGYLSGRDDTVLGRQAEASRECSFLNQAANNRLERALADAELQEQYILLLVLDDAPPESLSAARADLEQKRTAAQRASDELAENDEYTLAKVRQINNGERVRCTEQS